MKRGIDDDNIMGPMFPRLHVNDTEKGGPRAPPRNKMALYEQLSIPSQRFNPGQMPLRNNNPIKPVPIAPSSQGSGYERSMFLPLRVPPSVPTQIEKSHTEEINSNSPLAQLGRRTEVEYEDDFSVPIFDHSEMGQNNRKKQSSINTRKFTPLSPSYTDHFNMNQNSSENNLHKTSSIAPFLGNEERTRNEINMKEYTPSKGISVKPSTNYTTKEKIGGGSVMKNQEHHTPTFCFVEGNNSPNDDSNGEYLGDKTRGFEQRVIGERNDDDVSETSMAESLSSMDISPDDVVGIIGQKHFWKARRAFVNQQRVFGVQVFELHRLIKVQRLMAGSAHLLIKDSTYLAKASMKVPPTKKLPLEFVKIPPPPIAKHKRDRENPNPNFEHSTENANGNTSASSVKKVSQPPSNYVPYSDNPPPQPPAPMITDPNMGAWPYHQPSVHQWLVPVMSPSEGLIYKPYPGPGFAGPATLPGNYPPHQGVGFLPMDLPAGHHPGYFPPYGMQYPNHNISGSGIEQMNPALEPMSNNHPAQFSGGGANFTAQNQSSCSMTTQNNTAITRGLNISKPKDRTVQKSTASSPSAQIQQWETERNSENALPLFPTSPRPQNYTDKISRPRDAEITSRVIRVVPHNARTASENAARIFQSIQDGRKQLDSM